MHYRINIALNGRHFFATADHSIQDMETLREVHKSLAEHYTAEKGYEISITQWVTRGSDVTL
jgi:hypothetical protein